MISIAQDDNTSLKSIDPRYENQVKKLRQQKIGPKSQTGSSPAGDSQPVNKSILSQNGENVNNGITRLADANYDDRASAIHEISDIKRTAIGSVEPVGWNNFPMNGGSKSSDR